MPWYSKANQTVKGNSSGTYSGGPFKGVIHSTEGSSASGAISAFKSNNSWPHFLVDYAGVVWQFVDTSQAARALSNLSGGVQTNRESAIQIEVVGFAGKPNEHPAPQIDALKALMRWTEQTVGVKPVGPGRPFASAYGQKIVRFSNAEWDGFNGWCGHCHVPENDHWDPGVINLAALLPSEGVKAMYDPALNLGEVVASLPRPGGVVLLNRQGDIYAFNCKDCGAPGRHPEYWNRSTDRAAGLHPFGDEGYYVIKEGSSTVEGSAGWYGYPA